jgi:hypothetical protein
MVRTAECSHQNPEPADWRRKRGDVAAYSRRALRADYGCGAESAAVRDELSRRARP